MAVPTWVASVTPVSSAAGISPTYPANVNADQIAWLVVHTNNQPISKSSITDAIAAAASGNATDWAELEDPDAPGTPLRGQAGTAGSAGAICIQVFWRRCDGSEDSASISIADAGDHLIAGITITNGSPTSGVPYHKTKVTIDTVNTTAYSADGFVTTMSDCLVMIIFGRSNDSSSTAAISSHANADLSSVTERIEGGSTAGNGGGYSLAFGGKATAGTVGASTATSTTASGAPNKAFLQIAILSTTSVSSGVTGTVNSALGPVTTAAAAALQLKAQGNATLGALTSAAAAKVRLSGQANAALSPLTSSSVAKVLIKAQATTAFSPLTASSAGSLTIKGVGAITLAPLTGAAVSLLALRGIVNATLAPLTSVAHGGAPAIGGQVNVTLSPLSGEATAKVLLQAAANDNLDPLTATSAGQLVITGGMLAALEQLSGAASGQLIIGAIGGGTLDPVTSEAVGGIPLPVEIDPNRFLPSALGDPNLEVPANDTVIELPGGNYESLP